MPIAGGLRRALGDQARIGMVWMDAHGDGRIVETNEGPLRFVSFPTSAVTGRTMAPFCREVCGLSVPIDGRDVLAGDIHDGYDFYRPSFEAAGIRRLDEAAFADEGTFAAALDALASRVDALYLSVDADILAMKHIPSYEKEVPGGQELATVARNVRAVMATGKVCAYSLFCFDFDHYERGGEVTARSAETLLAAGLESWGELPG